jgi:hypothetical protein
MFFLINKYNLHSISLYPKLIIVQCMIHSFKGYARNTLLTLPESASPIHSIDKLEGIYGNVYSNDTLLLSFPLSLIHQNS